MLYHKKERFYHSRHTHPFRNLCLSLLVFFGICGLFFGGVSKMSARAVQEQKSSLENALWRGVTQYYTLEGHYPETLQDLKETCGIQYDTDLFFVDYQIAGANILPDITVIERQEAGK